MVRTFRTKEEKDFVRRSPTNELRSLPGTEFVDDLDESLCTFGRDFREDSVAEVENMSRRACRIENGFRSGFQRVEIGQERNGVTTALFPRLSKMATEVASTFM